MGATKARNRGLVIGLGGFFAGFFVHSVLPLGNIWADVALAAATCAVVSIGLAAATAHWSKS
jgi:hypothetical protein